MASSPALLAAGAPLMTVPGQANVNGTGGFTYSIPIAAPPGTSGMAPHLTLNYSSQAGDGYVGLGWSLGGLSVMTRCPQTLAQDNVHGGVNYDMNDRFCLDGQRLILTSGTYGADGSVYRTEVDHFSEIIAHGSAGHGPASFEVKLPNGLDLQYGYTSDSQILAKGSTTARAWAINQVTDPKGNYYTVTWENDQTNGQFYPTAIKYTGNASQGLATYNSIDFTYTTKTDIVPTYQAGSLIQSTKLLSNIETKNGSKIVLNYTLAYNPASSAASHDELKSVTLYDTDGDSIAATTFGWQGSRDAPAMTAVAEPVETSLTTVAPGDYNGDGVTDFLIQLPLEDCWSTGNVYFGSNANTFTSGNMTAAYQYYEADSTSLENYTGPACFQTGDSVPADINADGITDLAIDIPYYVQFHGNWTKVPSTSSVLSNTSAFSQSGPTGGNIFPLILTRSYDNLPSDFNGDAYPDGWGTVSGGTGYALLGNGAGTFTQDSGHTGFPTGATEFLSGDFDGNGCTDILAQAGGGGIVYFCQPAVATAPAPDWSGSQTVLGDYNGDNKTDVLVVNSSGAKLYLSTGTGFANPITLTNTGVDTWYQYTIVAGDWNGDGKTDILLLSQTSGQPHLVMLSTATGFEQLTTIANSDTGAAAIAADWNSDGASDIWMLDPRLSNEYLFSYVPELMTSVSNGIGSTTTVTYDRINKNQTLYTKCPGSTSYNCGTTYPTQSVDSPLYVVTTLATSNGIGGTDSWTYSYAGLTNNVNGRGLQGFSQMVVTNSQTGLVTTTDYNTAFPYTGTVSSQTIVSGARTLSSVVNTMQSTNEGGSSPGTAFYFVYLHQSVVSGEDLDGSALPTTTTTYTYDGYGNVHIKSASVSDGSSSVTTNTYNNDTTDWFLGQLLTSQTQNIVGTCPTACNLTRSLSATWTATNKPYQINIEPGNTLLNVEATMGYDSFDNANSRTLSGNGIASRTNGVTYDPTHHQFPTTATNALSQNDVRTFNAGFGELTSDTNVNNVTTQIKYDDFGRQIFLIAPDGNQIAIAYNYCSGVNGGSATCPTLGAYQTVSTPETSGGTQNGPVTTTYYDALNRVIAVQTQGFDGSTIETDTQYDADGRVAQTSRPYFVTGGTKEWTTYQYDALNRVVLATMPDTSTTQYGYHGLQTTVTNAQSETTTTTLNAQGLVASREDANGKTTTYVYDAFGDPYTITDPAGNVTAFTFDLRGRKTGMSDPDMGSWSYNWDVLNELTSQTDAKSQTTSLYYDLLGRPTQRVEPDMTSNWTWDATTHGVGALSTACTGTGCTTPTNSNYFRAPAYDSDGRPTSVALTIGGTTYNYAVGYDANGRVGTVTYPSGFEAQYNYNSYGYLSSIVDANNPGFAYWTANTRDAELHLTGATAGNGVVTTQSFDPETGRLLGICAVEGSGACNSATALANFVYQWDDIGRLQERQEQDTAETYTESFCYDALNRLQYYALASSCEASGHKTMGYDALGDITSKSDVGTYAYPPAGQPQPHAVSGITGTVNGVVNPTFAYDANGNMTSGAGRSITWTSFNMAASVVDGSATAGFTYDDRHSRITKTGTGPVVYVNDPITGAMSELASAAVTTTWHDFIVADGQIVAERFETGDTVTNSFFTSDHLGSATVLTNASGAVTARFSYDAWGRRRNADGSDSGTCLATGATTRGFTDQEMMDQQCYINLNARLYDPTIARIPSPDPTIPDGLNGQSFNRYSYVNNGPTYATDPSGYDQDSCAEGGACSPTCYNNCENPDPNANGTEPCWGCSGPGIWGVSPGGLVISAATMGSMLLELETGSLDVGEGAGMGGPGAVGGAIAGQSGSVPSTGTIDTSSPSGPDGSGGMPGSGGAGGYSTDGSFTGAVLEGPEGPCSNICAYEITPGDTNDQSDSYDTNGGFQLAAATFTINPLISRETGLDILLGATNRTFQSIQGKHWPTTNRTGPNSVFYGTYTKDYDTFNNSILIPALSMNPAEVVQFSAVTNTWDVITNLGYPVGTDLFGNPTSYVDVRMQIGEYLGWGIGSITGAFPTTGPKI